MPPDLFKQLSIPVKLNGILRKLIRYVEFGIKNNVDKNNVLFIFQIFK